MAAWSVSKWYSPYIALCQSSGYGKSKLLTELGRSGKYHVFYVCFRKAGPGGIPTATPHVQELCTSPDFSTAAHFEAFLCSCVEVAHTRAYSAVDLISLGASKDGGSGFWGDVMHLAHDFVRRNDMHLSCTFLEDCRRLNRDGSSNGVLFVFDEARQLLVREVTTAEKVKQNPFLLLREALRNLACVGTNLLPYFAVFADTTSRITNFAPVLQNDPSSRSVESNQLCQPCFVVETLGQVKTEMHRSGEVVHVSISGNRYSYNLARLVTWSRPMYVMEWEKPEKNETAITVWQNIRRFAITKLFNGKKADMKNMSEVGISEAIAIVACRINFIPLKCDREELVSSHMGTLLGLSDERDDILVEYVAEPVMGEAACFCWRVKDCIKRAIGHFCQCVKSGAFRQISSPGDIGEVVAMILLCRIYDRCAGAADCSPPSDSLFHTLEPCCSLTTVSKFLSSLLWASGSAIRFRDNIDDMVKLAGALADGVICFSQFVNSGESVTKEVLVEAAQRRVALKCRQCECDVDLVIPVIFNPSHTDVDFDIDDIGPENVGAVLIQVKNYWGARIPSAKLSKWAAKIGDYGLGFGDNFPYVGVIMAVGNSPIYKTKGKLKSMQVLEPAGNNPVYAVDRMYESMEDEL
jgi:hypothetical protein